MYQLNMQVFSRFSRTYIEVTQQESFMYTGWVACCFVPMFNWSSVVVPFFLALVYF